MILRRPVRDPDVEVLADDAVAARIESGELTKLHGQTPIDKARVQALRRAVARRIADRRRKACGPR